LLNDLFILCRKKRKKDINKDSKFYKNRCSETPHCGDSINFVAFFFIYLRILSESFRIYLQTIGILIFPFKEFLMNEIEVKTTVDQVTVYVDRARISRKGSVSPDPGNHQLAVPDLPLTLDPDSVRVKAAGTARAKILGVGVKKTFFKDVPPGKAKELTDQIQQLEDEDRVLADNVQSISGQIKHIDGMADSTKTFAVSLAKGKATGEDWHDIKLVLSTVPPTSGTGVPELDPWYIAPMRISRPMANVKFAAMGGEIPAAAPASMADATMAAEAEELEEVLEEIEEVEFTTAEIEQSGASVTYAIGNRVNIPGDGSPHKAMITYLKFSPQIDFVTAPKKECKAYRRVKVDNESDLMLLPGLAQIFEDEDFIGKAVLKMVAPGEKIKFYAGTDERIRVERKLVKRETDKKFLADKRRIRFSYEIKLENHTGKEQNIVVRDQIPLSRHEGIKVKLEEVEPKENKLDGLNRLKWEIKLPDKEKKTICYDFFIEYPRDMNVQGLP
jgi:hypothetical protein